VPASSRVIERHHALANLADVPERQETSHGPQVIRKADPVDVLEDRSASRSQLADAITRSVEGKGLDAEQVDHVRGGGAASLR